MGILGAERSAGFYGWMALAGYGIGLPLNSYSARIIVKSALGHVAVIILLCKFGLIKWLTSALGAIGQVWRCTDGSIAISFTTWSAQSGFSI